MKQLRCRIAADAENELSPGEEFTRNLISTYQVFIAFIAAGVIFWYAYKKG